MILILNDKIVDMHERNDFSVGTYMTIYQFVLSKDKYFRDKTEIYKCRLLFICAAAVVASKTRASAIEGDDVEYTAVNTKVFLMTDVVLNSKSF